MKPTIELSTVAWREGDRIASHRHGGYNDLVPDEHLERFAEDEDLHPEDRAFAALVLAFRRFERACAR